MPKIDVYTPGTFCWAELVAVDIDSAIVFYTTLLNWEPNERDLGDTGRYVRLRLNGRDIAAVHRLSEKERAFAPAAYWDSYISVADLDATLAKASSLDGRAFEGPMVVGDAGRMGAFEDPDGARICLWEPGDHIGAGWHRELGAPAWYQIATRQPDAIVHFYTGLLGWRAMTRDLGDIRYTSFVLGSENVAGLTTLTEDQCEIAAHWKIVFAVANCAATTEAAAALDATVLTPPTDIAGVGRYAEFRDPQGAPFGVIQMQDLSR